MGIVKQIDIKNLLFLERHYWSQKLWCIVVKNWQKSYKKLIFTTLDTSQFKKLMIVETFTELILCICVLIMQMDMLN